MAPEDRLTRSLPWVVFAATFLAFLPVLWNGFVGWDDGANITSNWRFRGFSAENLKWMWTSFHMGHYVPLTWLSLALDWTLWKDWAGGYHLTSLLLHAGGAGLFYFVMRALLAAASFHGRPAALAAAAAALFFSIHPLRVESVAWATERRDVLSGLFYFASLLFYLRAAADAPLAGRWRALSVLSFALMLLSRANALTLLATFLVLDLYPLRRLPGPRAREVLIEKVPYLLMSAAAGLTLLLSQAGVTAFSGDRPLLHRALSALHGAGFYVAKTLWPLGLAPVYRMPSEISASDPAVMGAAFLGAALLCAAVLWRRKSPAVASAAAHYLLTAAPALGVIESWSVTNDRYSYLPCLAWAALFGAGILRLSVSRRGAFAAGGVCLAVFAAFFELTWRQAAVWRDTKVLWTRAAAVSPGSSVPWSGLGKLAAAEGRYREAEAYFEKSLKIHPASFETLRAAGDLHRVAGNAERALELYQRAVQVAPRDPRGYESLGILFLTAGRRWEAAVAYRSALAKDPRSPAALADLGYLLVVEGRTGEGEAFLREAVRQNPGDADAWNNLGTALLALDHPEEAAAAVRRALEIRPSFAEARTNLGGALQRAGLLDQALREHLAAVRLAPSLAQPHFNAAVLLAHKGEKAKAALYYRRALEIDPSFQRAAEELRVLEKGKR